MCSQQQRYRRNQGSKNVYTRSYYLIINALYTETPLQKNRSMWYWYLQRSFNAWKCKNHICTIFCNHWRFNRVDIFVADCTLKSIISRVMKIFRVQIYCCCGGFNVCGFNFRIKYNDSSICKAWCLIKYFQDCRYIHIFKWGKIFFYRDERGGN